VRLEAEGASACLGFNLCDWSDMSYLGGGKSSEKAKIVEFRVSSQTVM